MARIPRVITINDISGYGRCSLTIAIPVLSVLGVQCCPIPTAVLSKHTGFKNFVFKDLTDILPGYVSDWQNSDISFDAIYSGFLGSFEQITITEELISSFENKPLCVIDTVMGDNGKIYSTYTEKMCNEMKRLVSVADVITPNLTEACYLTDTKYEGESISLEKAEELCYKLVKMGAKSVVITGVIIDGCMSNFVYQNFKKTIVNVRQLERVFSGTGDLFASVLTGQLVKGYPLVEAVRVASEFISDSLLYTLKIEADINEGVVFEPLLYKLGGDFYEK